ncbi:hypothetical protein H1D32_17605 [Anaerobacillus sp. CMMVII]|uniref:hypothetical protein n=1 Tax=Anaerobacillus sp. CMMVII TaxID=2755588 RepID=UPI0021B70CAD|nr:hypothetical protein [Anaerobacillus sp. CMMVII]MCT8139364.1 hypothetical protein [Anaerobacillus sp. CMMVII]
MFIYGSFFSKLGQLWTAFLFISLLHSELAPFTPHNSGSILAIHTVSSTIDDE